MTHIEPVGEKEALRAAVRVGSEQVRQAVMQLPAQVPGVQDCHSISLYREGNDLSVSFHCVAAPHLPITDAHKLTVQLESALRAPARTGARRHPPRAARDAGQVIRDQ